MGKSNIHKFTANNKHHTKLASTKEIDKNQKKLNINQLNSKTCNKIRFNENSNNEEG